MSKKKGHGGGLNPMGMVQWAAGFLVRFIEHAYHNILWIFQEGGRANRALDRTMPGLIARTTVPPSYIPFIKIGLVILIGCTLFVTGAYIVAFYVFVGITALQALAGTRH